MLLVPLFYCWVFFVKIPKKGLKDNNNIKTYGFLYERFLPECYYWELIELGRKSADAIQTWDPEMCRLGDPAFARALSGLRSC
tara:strand:+ start:1731 stop:1979 length:249 start_codon:yes stop_codon:yes gene_type:complete